MPFRNFQHLSGCLFIPYSHYYSLYRNVKTFKNVLSYTTIVISAFRNEYNQQNFVFSFRYEYFQKLYSDLYIQYFCQSKSFAIVSKRFRNFEMLLSEFTFCCKLSSYSVKLWVHIFVCDKLVFILTNNFNSNF